MNKDKLFCVGRDDDGGWFGLVLILIVVAMILALVVYGGAFIGGFYSIKNYIVSFKENVIDSNRGLQTA